MNYINHTLYTAESTLLTKQCSTTSHAARQSRHSERQEGSRTRLQMKNKKELIGEYQPMAQHDAGYTDGDSISGIAEGLKSG